MIKTVIVDERKWLLRLNQKVMEEGIASEVYAFVTHMPPGQMQAPKPTYFSKWNVETSYRSPYGLQTGIPVGRGRQTAKSADGGAGTGARRKRTPFCNGADKDCDMILRESGQTSSWSLFTREFTEPSLREESK